MIEITKWSETFESAKTRKYVGLQYYHAPSGNDSRGYRRLLREGVNGAVALGVFQALCQVMACLSEKVRKTGQFVFSTGEPMEMVDILESTRMDEAYLMPALLLLKKVGWISFLNESVKEDLPLFTQPSPNEDPTFTQSKTGSCPIGKDRKGKDRKGEEGKGIGEPSAEPPTDTNDEPPPLKIFEEVPPSAGDGCADVDESMRSVLLKTITDLLVKAFPYDAKSLRSVEEGFLKTQLPWLAENMTDEHWRALGYWMRLTPKQRGNLTLFPRDRAEFLRDPAASLPKWWGWWSRGGRMKFKTQESSKAKNPMAEIENETDITDEEGLAILKGKEAL